MLIEQWFPIAIVPHNNMCLEHDDPESIVNT